MDELSMITASSPLKIIYQDAPICTVFLHFFRAGKAEKLDVQRYDLSNLVVTKTITDTFQIVLWHNENRISNLGLCIVHNEEMSGAY